MTKPKIYTVAHPEDLSPPLANQGFCVDVVLASDYAALEQELTSARRQIEVLAAENVALKSSREVLSENALESCNSIACAGFRHEAIMRGLYASTGNGNKYPKPITTLVDEAMRKLETPATDRIVAGIKADGVALTKSAFEKHIQSTSCYQDEMVGMESALSIACQVESQLREGAK